MPELAPQAASATPVPGPLSRVRVLDLTQHRAGPTAVRQLADWGADVVKIEPPTTAGGDAVGGSRHGCDFQNLHRNKRAMTLNLKSAEGREIFFRLVRDADVVVENYRSDVKHRLGIAYEALAAINPRIVYGSISGFGQSGPDATRPGVDQIAQGLGGLMSITGLPGQGPVRVGIPIADLTAGLLLAQAILLALYQREHTGKGQWVHTSLLEAQLFMLDFQAARWLIAGEIPQQAGNDHPTGVPTGVFPTSDGHVNIAASGNVLFERLCLAIGAPELRADPQFATPQARLKHRALLNARIAAITCKQPRAHWVALLSAAGVPAGAINSIDQAFAEPQVEHLAIARPVEHPSLGSITVVGQPITLTSAPQPAAMRPAPDLGAHTDEVLSALGFGAGAVADLRARGIV